MYSFLNRVFPFLFHVKPLPEELKPRLQTMTYKDGTVNVLYKFPNIQILAKEMYGFFNENNGVNFVRGKMYSEDAEQELYFAIGLAERPDAMEIIQTMRDTLELIAQSNIYDVRTALVMIVKARETLNKLGYKWEIKDDDR